MNYQRPEIAPLGSASILIQGSNTFNVISDNQAGGSYRPQMFSSKLEEN